MQPASGLIIEYDYLWAHEADRGQATGRKARPCCVHIMLRAERGTVSLLFPITTRPAPSRVAVAIPDTELRRAHLAAGSFVVVDEWNQDDLSASPFVADPTPRGRFSAVFMRRIQDAALQAIKSHAYRSIPRRR